MPSGCCAATDWPLRRPRQDLIVAGAQPLRLAEREGKLAAYSPYTQAVTFALPRKPSAAQAYDLHLRTMLPVETDYDGGRLHVAQPEIIADFAIFID